MSGLFRFVEMTLSFQGQQYTWRIYVRHAFSLSSILGTLMAAVTSSIIA
jgi:hypothetical protein